MKKFVLFLLIFTGSITSAYSFVAVDSSLNYIDATGKKQGHWIVYGRMQTNKAYGADAKVEEGKYLDNSKVGVWIGFYPNGNKQKELTYVNNRPNGLATIYNEQGIKTEEGTWVGTHWVGAYQMFWDDGTPRQKFNYSATGQRDGAQTYINPNGTKSIEVTEHGGKEDGWKKEYDENGNLIRETFYAGGVMDPSKTIEHQVKTATPKTSPDDPANDKVHPPPPPPPPAPVNWNGEGPYTLMRNGQVSQKGTFHSFKLVDGEVRFYNDNGMLTEIKLYKGGKYVADAPLPDDSN